MQKEQIEILELIKYYVMHDKKCNREYIMTLIELLTKYRYLESYIDLSKSKIIRLSFKTSYAEYDSSCKAVITYLNNLLKMLSKTQKRLEDRFIRIEIEFKLLLIVLEVISHETEHATQAKIMEEGEDSLKRRILNYSMIPLNTLCPPISEDELKRRGTIAVLKEASIKIDRVKKTAKKMYTIAPHEFMAEAWATEFSLEILSELYKEYGEDLSRLWNYDYFLKLYKNLQHYKTTLTPTRDYLSSLGILDLPDINLDLRGKGMSLDERMYLGLEITEDELKAKTVEYTNGIIQSKM